MMTCIIQKNTLLKQRQLKQQEKALQQHLKQETMKMNLPMKTENYQQNLMLMNQVTHTLPTIIMETFTIMTIITIMNIQHVFVDSMLHIPGFPIIMDTTPITIGTLTTLTTGV